ncbi:transglycosylase family protein [Streptomyces reniochalinae]|uniref:Peptidase n=1 Tax=Streptomyces reniochalinae TaxID=2250578 RepID=A0A367ECL3_9ACTN|nr:transglycosylase family protein [Streptomyces reniochalinae]RCG15415.1 peptidase [Streptomyces reniochalinae]
MSARGRHRRPQPRSAARVSATVTAGGAGIALPLVAAQLAYAAPQDVWEKVAACESSGKWDINTGNGHYGGLQFTADTWAAYGGRAYAPRADLASPSEQVAIAERVLAGQGPGAWPHCGPRAGLARGGAEAQGGGARPQAEQPGSDEAKSVKARTSQGQEAGRARASKDKADRARAERLKKQTTYEVVSGDTLSGIAEARSVEGGWHRLYDWNRSAIGGDPDLILPGQRLETTGPPQKTGRKQSGPDRAEHPPASGHKARQKQSPEKEAAQKKAPQKSAPRQDVPQQQAPRGRAPEKKAPRASGGSATAPVAGVGPSTAYRAPGGSWSSGHHTGVDFPVSTGTSVKAVLGGTVVSAGWQDAYGYQVVLRHSDGRYSQYGHLSAISVRAGQSVGAGTRIGRSGATGNATGPHLHFEVRTGPGYGSDIDPLAYLRQHGVRL